MSFKEMVVQNVISSELDRAASKAIPVQIGKILFDYISDPKLRRKVVSVLLLPAVREFVKDDKVFAELLDETKTGL